MLFSASFTSTNGSTEGTIQWGGIDVASSSLTVAGTDVPLTESSGTTSFDLDGLVLIDFEMGNVTFGTGNAALPETGGLPPGWTEIGQDVPSLPWHDLILFA